MPHNRPKGLSEKFFEIMELKSAKAIVVILCAAIIMMIIILSGSFFQDKTLEIINDYVDGVRADDDIPPPDTVTVHIKGEVSKPGLYELSKGSRVSDALEAAGGGTEDTDIERINLAEKIVDGQEVIFPAKGQTADVAATAVPRTSSGGGKAPASNTVQAVNINTAGRDELMSLPGIGASYADRIIGFRTEFGGFARPEEIMRVKGISRGVYDGIKEYIKVSAD